MAGKEVKVKDGVTVTEEAVFVGDYMFKIEGNVIQKYKKKQDAIHGDVAEYEEKVKEIMAKLYAFYGKFQKENQYVKRGSILKCSGGTKLTKFDLLKDHGVMELGGGPIGICSDCKTDHNIYSFGGCNKPTPSGYPERPLEIPTINSKFPFLMHKCIPLLNGNWSKTNSGKLRVWDEEKRAYCDAITTGDYLTCFYGGIISVIEVPQKVNTKEELISLEKMISLGWTQIQCGYNIKGTNTQSPINDMNSEITRRFRDINQGDIDKINNLFKRYDINTKKRICAFFAECSAETSDGKGLIEQAVDKGDTRKLNIKYLFSAKPTRANLKKWFDDNRKYKYIYRGGGTIQLTWDYHYTEFNDWLIQEFGIKDEKIIELGAEYVASTYPWEAGVFYWERYNLNEKADKLKDNYVRRDIDIITNVVNRGMSEAEKTNRDDKYKWWLNNFTLNKQ